MRSALHVGLCLALAAWPGVAVPAHAQGAGAPGLDRLQPGQRVRIRAADQAVREGTIVGSRDGHLLVEGAAPAGAPVAIPLAAIETVWVKTRATRKGAIVGGLVAGLAGAGLAAFATGAACEGDCSVLGGAAVGLAVGAATGALVGALIGAGSAQWRVAYHAGSGPPTEAPVVAAVPDPRQGESIGSAAVHAGFDKAIGDLAPDGGVGGHVRWTAELGGVRPGLGLGWLGLGGRSVVAASNATLSYDESVFYVEPLVCFGPSRGRVRPYAVAGVGYYRWTAFDPQVLDSQSGVEVPTSTRDFLGGSLAGGVRFQARPTLSFELQAAFHTNLSAVPEVAAGEPERRLQVLSISGGASLSW